MIMLLLIQVRVQGVSIDGLQRTKDDILVLHINRLFHAKNFEEVSIKFLTSDSFTSGLCAP